MAPWLALACLGSLAPWLLGALDPWCLIGLKVLIKYNILPNA